MPAYIADELRRMTPSGSVENAGHLLIDAADGLRVLNEVEQLAAFEDAACRTSSGVRRLLHELRPGMREDDAVALLGWNGMPALLPPDALERRPGDASACSARPTGRSSAATGSRWRSGSGAP